MRGQDGGQERRLGEATVPQAVAEYKSILKAALDVRPSGCRQRLATAIGRNPSFVSQITNPTYPVPIPATHVDKIIEVCRLTPEESGAFLAAYTRAHPRKARSIAAPARRATRRLVLNVPDFGVDQANAKFDSALEDFVRRLGGVMEGDRGEGG